MDRDVKKVELKLPLEAAYVSIARLSAAGIANSIGFDIEEIEDVKVAISEVCNKLVSGYKGVNTSYTIEFSILPNKMIIVFKCDLKNMQLLLGDENELGMAIIDALMDEVDVKPNKDGIFSMSKAIEGN